MTISPIAISLLRHVMSSSGHINIILLPKMHWNMLHVKGYNSMAMQAVCWFPSLAAMRENYVNKRDDEGCSLCQMSPDCSSWHWTILICPLGKLLSLYQQGSGRIDSTTREDSSQRSWLWGTRREPELPSSLHCWQRCNQACLADLAQLVTSSGASSSILY